MALKNKAAALFFLCLGVFETLYKEHNDEGAGQSKNQSRNDEGLTQCQQVGHPSKKGCDDCKEGPYYETPYRQNGGPYFGGRHHIHDVFKYRGGYAPGHVEYQ